LQAAAPVAGKPAANPKAKSTAKAKS
jgi:hypothetical protein